ncbi:hypothetical protein ES708_30259 [subsurface metagenome]
MGWIVANWEVVLVLFVVAEKIVKVSPAAWDDILVDGIRYIATKIYNAYVKP